MIACVVLPDVVSLVEQNNGSNVILLNGMGKVQAASNSTVQAGVRRLMCPRQVLALCPAAQIHTFNEGPYLQWAEKLLELLREFTTRIEPLPAFWERKKHKTQPHPSAAMFYLDLGKLTANAGLELAHYIGEHIHHLYHTDCCIGLARGKFPAFIAARYAKPGHPNLVRPGEEGAFLALLPITLLPLGKELSRRLQLLGIGKLGELAALPAGSVVMQLGKQGRFLHHLAQGIDMRPVVPRPVKPTYRIVKPLEGAVENAYIIEMLLRNVGTDIETYLRERNFTLQVVDLLLHLDNGAKSVSSNTLREPTSNGKVIGRCLLRLFRNMELSSGVVTVEVTAKDLVPVVWQQLDLFGTPALTQNRLSDLLEALTARFGNDSIYQVQVEKTDHLLIECRFTLEQVEAA